MKRAGKGRPRNLCQTMKAAHKGGDRLLYSRPGIHRGRRPRGLRENKRKGWLSGSQPAAEMDAFKNRLYHTMIMLATKILIAVPFSCIGMCLPETELYTQCTLS